MDIKINSFSSISYQANMAIVTEYLKQFEEKLPHTKTPGDIIYGSGTKVKLTGKSPVVIRTNRNYHVTCRMTLTQYIFNIWLAV